MIEQCLNTGLSLCCHIVIFSCKEEGIGENIKSVKQEERERERERECEEREHEDRCQTWRLMSLLYGQLKDSQTAMGTTSQDTLGE